MKTYWALFEDISAGTFFSVGITLIFYGVVMRYVFNDPKPWVEEVSRYAVIWGAMLGIPIALRNNHHIQVDMLYEKLPAYMRRWVDIFASSVGILFCLFYTYYGFMLVYKRYSSGMVSMDVGVPMWIIYLILPISGVMFLLRFTERLADVWRGKEVSHDNPVI
ncbi:MAG: TRAP transporter small permease [Paenibacillaceae bacterium]